MPQRTPARVCLSDFPDEILSLIFSHADTVTLLGAIPNACRGWRAACTNDDHRPKVRLELHSIRQVLRIRPDCLGLWVAATVGQFPWVIDLDLSRCDIGSLQRTTRLNVSECNDVTDAGLEHVAQLTQLSSLNLGSCRQITDTGLEHVAQLTQLSSLDLTCCYESTDTGLEHVAYVAQLCP